jgi:hypothetical protein
MPVQPQWLLRLPEIILELEQLDVPIVDRAIFERVFEVRRRRAIQLMHHFGGHQVGRTFIIDRKRLLDQLRGWKGSENFDHEQIRRLRVVDELDRVRKLSPGRKVRIQVPSGARDNRLAELPAGIHLKPGELRIEFFGTEDLLRHLFELSQAIANDYKRFERICEEGETQDLSRY